MKKVLQYGKNETVVPLYIHGTLNDVIIYFVIKIGEV